jgi:ADP-ribose pyrophosphatase YjhB (NUDIX family)
VDVQISLERKEQLARLMRRPVFRSLLPLAVRVAVPKQRVGVALVAFNSDEEVLLLRHVYHPTAPWGLPGGWLGRNEDPAAGLARELREETGLSVVVGRPVIALYDPLPPHIVMAFLGDVESGDLTLGPEILDAHWFPVDSLPEPVLPFTRCAISAAQPLLHVAAPRTPRPVA